jgi:hypothetical protein
MGSKHIGTTAGQAAWQRTGTEMSQEEMSELQGLKAKIRGGVVLTFAEQDRLHILKGKLISVPHER